MKPEHEKYILENIDKKTVKEISLDLNLKERKVKKFLSKRKDKQAQMKKESGSALVNKQLIFISIALIIILGFCAYGNSIKGQFLYDDETLVTDNIFITNWAYLPDVFKEDIGAGAGKESNPYRPFQVLTYMMDYSLWELDARGYHLTNVICHILTALCIYWFIAILFGDWLLSLVASLFFVVHPIHTQAVSYIAGRADCLAALLMFTCMILYIKQTRTKNIYAYFFMMVSYALAILSRENSLILPVLLLLYHYVFKKGIHVKKYLSLLSIAFGYILFRSVFFRHLMPDTPLHNTTLFQRMPGFFVAVTKYMQLLVLPLDLHMEYGDKLFKLSDPKAILGAIILSFLIFFIVKKRKRNRLVLFCGLWFLVTLLPSSNIYPINAYMAEHWLYLPSIGFFLILAKGLSVLFRKENFRKHAVVICGGLLCFYTFLTFQQNVSYWRDPVAFYQRTIKYAPDSYNAHNNLGKIYYSMGRKEEAITLFKRAIEINPWEANSYNNLAAVSYEAGKNEEYMIGLLKKAVKFDPYHAKARYNLGKLYKDIGEEEKAIPEFKKAIELNPNYVEAYDKLGVLYGKTGRKEEAINFFNKALAIDPSYAEAYHSLGSFYNDLNMREESIHYLKKAIQVKPDYGMAHTNLAMVYYYNGEYDLAVEHCNKAKELGFQVPSEFLKLVESYKTP